MYELRYTRYEVQSQAPAAQCCKAEHELPLSLRLYVYLLLRILNLVTRTSNYNFSGAISINQNGKMTNGIGLTPSKPLPKPAKKAA